MVVAIEVIALRAVEAMRVPEEFPGDPPLPSIEENLGGRGGSSIKRFDLEALRRMCGDLHTDVPSLRLLLAQSIIDMRSSPPIRTPSDPPC
jgi:hypothetical protein